MKKTTGEARVTQWREHSPPSNVARASNPGVDALCEWLSPLLQDVFVLPFFPSLKTQNTTFNLESMGDVCTSFSQQQSALWQKKLPIYNFIRPPLRMDSFGKHKRRDEAKEISFKKFQKSATKHDTFVINDKGKRL